MPESHSPFSNVFLASLPRDDYARLEPHIELVSLPLRQILFEAGEPIEHCTFPDEGMISLVIRLDNGAAIETGVVGKEGFVGFSALMAEAIAPHTAMVQMPGNGMRIDAHRFREEMLRSPAILERVLRFVQAVNIQVAQTAACNAQHTLQERLARWLLMARDRAEGDRLPLTQEFLSVMLAVRRSGVTVAAGSLQGIGAIHYTRGEINVLDRERLEEASCECYAAVRSHLQRLLGWPGDPSAPHPPNPILPPLPRDRVAP